LKNIAPFGSWPSLITSDLIVSQTIGFAGIVENVIAVALAISRLTNL
jgi:hypothetical protein